MKVQSIPSDLIGSTTYDSEASQVTYDVAYDLWLSASDTKTPCKTNGNLEVMVWTDYDARSLLPDGMKVGTATVPFTANGAVHTGDQAWSVYAATCTRKDAPRHGAGPSGSSWIRRTRVRKGAVAVDLSAALAAVGTLLQNNYGWSNVGSNYWLDTIAFGIEFGPKDGDLVRRGTDCVLAESHIILPSDEDDGRGGRLLSVVPRLCPIGDPTVATRSGEPAVVGGTGASFPGCATRELDGPWLRERQ